MINVNTDSIPVPSGTKAVNSPKYALESFVTSADDPIPGEVVLAVSGTFYLVAFEDEGELEWYPESALTASTLTESDVQEAAEKARYGTIADMVNYAKIKNKIKG